MKYSHPPIDLILFDLGGVIVELGGVGQLLDWSKRLHSEEEMWRRWLDSQTVRVFESGKSSPRQFASAMITEFNLQVTAERFLSAFIHWPHRPYTGARHLLSHLSSQYPLGTLSNTNELHWHRIKVEMDFMHLFDWTFPSHLTGRLKPDLDAFAYVLQKTGFKAPRLLFFDDNQMNVDAARTIGMQAYRACGVEEVTKIINDLDLNLI